MFRSSNAERITVLRRPMGGSRGGGGGGGGGGGLQSGRMTQTNWYHILNLFGMNSILSDKCTTQGTHRSNTGLSILQ